MDDRQKWNKKYEEKLKDQKEPEPNGRLEKLAPYLKGGSALELACGLGGNSLFLAGLGFEVQAVDISETAAAYVRKKAEERNLNVIAVAKDITESGNLPFARESFGLVVITYYLERSLFPYVKGLIKANGLFFMETFYHSPEIRDHKVSGRFRLKPNELLEEFRGWQILFFEENEPEGRQTILCRKPTE